MASFSAPSIEAVRQYFASREAQLRNSVVDRNDLGRKLDGMHYEATTVDIVLGVARSWSLDLQMTLDDLNPRLRDRAGTEVEIDLRVTLSGQPLLIGTTHFTYNDRDLLKDSREIEHELTDYTVAAVPMPAQSRVVRHQSRSSVLRRKIANRVATEGRHQMAEQYIYFLYFQEAWAPWVPGLVPAAFRFEDPLRDSYHVQNVAFSGLVLVGRDDVSSATWSFHTHVLARADATAQRFLAMLNTRKFDPLS